MYEIFILLKGCSRGYVTDKNVKQVCRKNVKLLRRLYGVLSCLLQVNPTHYMII